METQHVNPAVIGVWRLRSALFVLPMLIPIVLLWVLVSAWLAIPAVLVAGILVLCWILPPIHYRNLQYGVDATGIVIRRGMLWRTHTAVPRVRIQHTDVSQGPLQRRFGVSTLKLYTAGSRYTKIKLPGLAHEEALALRDSLIAQHGSDSGV